MPSAARKKRFGGESGAGLVKLYWFRRPRFPLSCHLYARGPRRGLPVASGSLANAIGRAKTTAAPLSPLLSPLRATTLFPYTTLFRSARQRDRSRQNNRGARACSSPAFRRAEEHTSELQSHAKVVCRPQLEKKDSAANLAQA